MGAAVPKLRTKPERIVVYLVYVRNRPDAPPFVEKLYLDRKLAERYVAQAHPSFREQHLIWIQDRVVSTEPWQ